MPLRYPTSEDISATVPTSLQNRVNSITPCITLRTKNWENTPCNTVHSDCMDVLYVRWLSIEGT